MARSTDRVDSEIANLSGGIFDALPQQEMPLEAYRLHEKVIEPASDFDHATTQVMRRVKLDSIAPVALMAPVIERSPAPDPRPAGWSVGLAAFGVACLAAAGLLVQAKRPEAPTAASTPAVAQVVVAAPLPEVAPVPAAPPAAPVRVEAPAAKPAAPAPKAAPRVAVVAQKAAEEARTAPVPTADLPIEMPEIPAAPRAPEVPFKASAAAVAIAAAGLQASACKDGQGSMSVPVSVTFVASGRATRATVNGGPFVGTSAGGCIAQALRAATVPPFDGEPVTVSTSVHLP